MNWHCIDPEQTFKILSSSSIGLSSAEASQRLEKFGPNELMEVKRKSPIILFLLQFKDFMILLLIGAALISGFIGDVKDTIVIMGIVILNSVAGFIQEFKAEKAMMELKKMAISNANVLRDGKELKISSSFLVPGDIILLDEGNMVSADLKLIESHALKIDEASLTGESHPVEKEIGELDCEDIQISDRKNMAWKGTLVTTGKGKGIVVETGMQTQMGSIAKILQEKGTLTPLQIRLKDFSKKLSVLIIFICLMLYLVGIWRGEDPVQMLMTAISVAVAAIPEALPAVITISLAFGAIKLAKKNALIRKLPAVETLGSVTIICTDKTGTLTQNKMEVMETWAYDSNSIPNLSITKKDLLLISMYANQNVRMNNHEKFIGDPTEISLVQFAISKPEFKVDWKNKLRRIREIPFDSARKRMTTIHHFPDKTIAITKGAVEGILKISNNAREEEISSRVEKMAEKGMRVIAYSYKFIDKNPELIKPEEVESDMSFLGIAGMVDPPRPEAKASISECIRSGITPIMITGDHPITARAIAKHLGIMTSERDLVITGPEFSRLSLAEREKKIEEIKVYARVSPEQKFEIVKLLQKKGHFVAMTGDGVNDAPALKRANIGIAMGIKGTDVSKEAAHMILLDDNFATIVNAVREGRRIYDNIRKFIRYILTCNTAEIWTIFIAPLIGLPVPLLPVHILWINLVTDGLPGLALAREPGEKNIMERKPRRPQESIFAGGMGFHILWIGILMAAISIGIQHWAIQNNHEAWQTMVFTVLCLSQLGHALAIRSEKYFLYKIGFFTNKPLIGAIILTFILQLIIVYWPIANSFFNTTPLTLKEFIICMLISTIVFWGVEFEKVVRKRIYKG